MFCTKLENLRLLNQKLPSLLDLIRLELSNLDLSSLDLLSLGPPSIDLPSLDPPILDLSTSSLDPHSMGLISLFHPLSSPDLTSLDIIKVKITVLNLIPLEWKD